jgi:hypothetical protein
MSARTVANSVARGLSLGVAGLLAALALSDSPWLGGGPGLRIVEMAVLGVAALLVATGLLLPQWNAGVLSIVLSSVATLVAAELLVRPFLTPRYRTPFQLDERRIYAPVPNAARDYRRQLVNGGDRITYQFGTEGFRGASLARPKSAPRVVVYGDSFIQAEYSSDEHTFAAQLGKSLAFSTGAPVEVVNAGVAGYGPDQALRRMEDELGWIEADLVVVSIYAGNDFGDLVRNKLYRIAPDGTLQDNPYVLSDEIRLRMELARSEPILRRVVREFRTALRRSGTQARAPDDAERAAKVERYLAQLQAEHHEFVDDRNDVVHELLSDPYNADVMLLPDSDSARYKVRMMQAVMERMAAAADAHRVLLFFVFVPHAIDSTSRHDAGRVDAAKYPQYRPSRGTDELVAIARRLGRPYLDLFGPFSEHGADDLYFAGLDDHWNDAGQELAAKLASDEIVARGLLDAAAGRATAGTEPGR